jgi:hypothetical protein
MRVLSPRDACLFIRLSVPLSTVCRKPHARRHEKHPKSGSIPVTFSLVLQESIKGVFSADDRGRGGRKHCRPRAVARCGSVAANILEMIGWSDRLGQGCRTLFLKSVLATAVLLLSLPAVEASSVPAYHFTGDVFFNFSPPDRLSPNDFGSFSLLDGSFGSVSLSAFGTPSPSIVANADIGTGLIPIIFGRGDGILTYSFEIIGHSGAVPVLIDAAGAVSGSATPGASFAVESRWDLFDLGHVRLAGDDIRSGQMSGEFNQNFSHTVSLSVAANQVYSVSMLADASSAATDLGSHATANALIDPIFSFGPGVDPLSYSFIFSDGIGNAASAGVPEPGTLVLLSAGLLSLGLVRLHRSAKTANCQDRERDTTDKNFKSYASFTKLQRTCAAAGFRSRDVARADLKDLSPVVGGNAGP